MARTARASVGGMCYHVLNRGNNRATVFHDEADYRRFVALMIKASERIPMRLLSFCLMPNHIHLCVWTYEDGDLGAWMHWLMTSHVRSHHRRYETDGHVWQGRFKCFPIQGDRHLTTMFRYIERNPLRARLVDRAEQWRWSSLNPRAAQFLSHSPVERSDEWLQVVNEPRGDEELPRIRASANRGTPFGDDTWMKQTAANLDLESAMHARGRPRK